MKTKLYNLFKTTKLVINSRWQVKWQLSFLIGLLLGIIIFLHTYGTRILNPAYDTWLLTEWFDLSQHYVGSLLYRTGGWHFPFGLTDNSFYPYLASVIYTDSIPILSLIIKILSPILPETFQLFGFYGLICYALQGGFAKLILRRVCKNELFACLGSFFFIMCTPVYHRMYYHTALGSHYLILAAIALFVYRDKLKTLQETILWCLLGMLTISTHFTLYAIISVVFTGYLLWEILDRKKALPAAVMLPAYLVTTIAVFYCFGGFYGSISGEASGLGDYSANLNSLFNPLGFSSLIKDLPHFDEQHEGNAYIGFAGIFLLLAGIPVFLKEGKYLLKNKLPLLISLLYTHTVLWIIALSPKVTLGDKVLYTIPCPDFLLDLWSIFRSSGRFIWPVTYAVLFLGLYYCGKGYKKTFFPLLLLLVLIHFYEYSGITHNLQEQYGPEKNKSYSADVLEGYDLTEKTHLQFMHPYSFGEYYGDETRDQMIGYTMLALRHDMTVSNFHFSRDDMDALNAQIDQSRNEVTSEDIRSDTIYVFTLDDFNDTDFSGCSDRAEFIYTDTEVIVMTHY